MNSYESSRNNNDLSILQSSPIVVQDLKSQAHADLQKLCRWTLLCNLASDCARGFGSATANPVNIFFQLFQEINFMELN